MIPGDSGSGDRPATAHAGTVSVRVAGAADAVGVVALTEHAYRVDGYLDLDGGDRYAGELLDADTRIRDAVVLVAQAGDELIGTVTLATFETPFAEISRPGEMEVRMLAVAPEARRRGVAVELMDATLDLARSDGLTRIVLSTEVSRHAVHRFYERLGYTRLPERDWKVDGFALIAYGYDVD